MKMEYAEYNESTGLSIVILQKNQNYFIGEVELHEEDADVASSYAGCHFAELKAIIKMLKYDYKEKMKEIRTLERLYKDITGLRDFHIHKYSRPVKHLRKQIKIKSEEALLIKERYEFLKASYSNIVDERLKAIRQIPKTLKQADFIKTLASS